MNEVRKRHGKKTPPFYRYVYGIGYIGKGKYSPKEHTKLYSQWYTMIKTSYENSITVTDGWDSFQQYCRDNK